MGRPSKAEEKRQTILDAYERVILREGFGLASQRKIAEEANVKQPMIHHYFGGSDDLIDALLDRVVERYTHALDTFAKAEQEPSLEHLLSFACSAEFHQVSQQNEVFFSFMIGSGEQNPQIAEKVSSVYQFLLDLITEHLKKAKVKNYKEMSYLMMCLILGHDWARKLGFGEGHNDDMTHLLTKLVKK